MKIIIPMSGIGKRFVDAGYNIPKPLIMVNGKPIIEHVVSMFKGDHTFIFICNQDHLKNTSMREVLKKIKPEGVIIPIKYHRKGPVHDTTFAFNYVKDDEEVFISYCDYFMEFDFNQMISEVNLHNYAGAVPSYTGFHPHLLHNNFYGGVLVDENNTMLDYREKHSFTENLMDSFHSAGGYYFRTAKELKDYTKELLESNISINGEQYTSMLYYLYLRDKKKIYVPTVHRFMQWGTPKDLEEYEAWARYFINTLGNKMALTSIPKERENFVKIPYKDNDELFKKCYTYWKSHFIN